MRTHKVYLGIFTIACLLAIAVCMICDLAISKHFSWSLIATSSIVFGWFVLSPAILHVKGWFYKSLIISSILIIPFIYILSVLLKLPEVFSIGAIMSIIGIIYLWSVAGICYKLKRQKYLAASLAVLLAAPVNLIINLILSKMLSQPEIDEWDILPTVLLFIIAAILFTLNYLKHPKENK